MCVEAWLIFTAFFFFSLNNKEQNRFKSNCLNIFVYVPSSLHVTSIEIFLCIKKRVHCAAFHNSIGTTHQGINSLSMRQTDTLPERMTSTYCISVLGKEMLLKPAFTADALDSVNPSEQEKCFLPFPFCCRLTEMPSVLRTQWSLSAAWILVLEPAASAIKHSQSPSSLLEFKNAKHILTNRSHLPNPSHAWLYYVNSRFLCFFIKEFFFLLSQLYSVSEFFFGLRSLPNYPVTFCSKIAVLAW